MPLEDSDRIDIVTAPAPGKLDLIVTDSGITSDPHRRHRLLLRKLRSYAAYVLDPDFGGRHPGVTPADVSITVVCHDPPSGEMAAITEIVLGADRGAIPVRFRVFRGAN